MLLFFFFLMMRRPPRSTRTDTLFPYTTRFRSQVDVTVFAYAPSTSKAFHFVALSPEGQGLGAMTSKVQSFRTLSASDAAAIRARYVRVVTVKAGDTPTSLADRMAFPDHKLERFLVLNGLDSGARLAAGQKVKLVTY